MPSQLRALSPHFFRFTRAISIGTLAALLGCSRGQSGAGNGGAAWGLDPSEFSHDPQSCQSFIAKLPAGFFHDWIDVPENPLDTSSPRLKIFYYGRGSSTGLHDGNVVLFHNGGPAADSHATARSLEKELAARGLKEKISFVYMDQRGTGCSSAYPAGHSDDIVQRLQWYGSTGIVYDSEALRAKLIGDRKWKVFGQSYGAFIVHRYVALFPKSLGGAFAYANTLSADPLVRLQERIASQLRVTAQFLAVYPDDEARLARLAELLPSSVCVSTAATASASTTAPSSTSTPAAPATSLEKYCGHSILSGLVSVLGWSNRWPELHKILGTLLLPGQPVESASLNEDGLKKFVAGNLGSSTTGSVWANIVIGSYDRNAAPLDSAHCTEVYARIRAALGSTFKSFAINECMGAIQTYEHSAFRDHVDNLFAGKADFLDTASVAAGARQMTPGSFFLYSGDRDCYVPKETFAPEVAALMDLVRYTNFPLSGHEGYRTEAQVWSDLQL